MSGVLVDFVEFARNVVVKIEQSAVDVLRPVDRRLVLAGPRLDVDDGNAGVERAEILLRLAAKEEEEEKSFSVQNRRIDRSSLPNRRCWQSEWRPERLRSAGFRSASQTGERKKENQRPNNQNSKKIVIHTMALSRTRAVSTYLVTSRTSRFSRSFDFGF